MELKAVVEQLCLIYKDYLIKTGISKEQLISINLEDIVFGFLHAILI